MSQPAADEVAAIAPEGAAAAHQAFEHLYAPTLRELAGLHLRWRIDVETRAPGQSPAQQHQLVIWDARQPTSYGLRLWLQATGAVTGHAGAPLSAPTLLGYVRRYLDQQARAREAEQRHYARQARRAQQLRRVLYGLAVALTVGNVVALGAFGATRWVAAARDTTLLLLLLAITFDCWQHYHLRQLRPAPQGGSQAVGTSNPNTSI